ARPQCVPASTTPKLLCPSPQGATSPFQYIERSVMIATSDDTTVETAAFLRRGSGSVPMLIVSRRFAWIAFDSVIVSPVSSRNCTVTLAITCCGLLSSTNVSKKLPVAPSARNHDRDGAATPVDSCPPLQRRVGVVPKYIERSAMMGWLPWTTIPNDVLTMSGIVPQSRVKRADAGTVTVFTTGGRASRRNVSVTSAGVALAFASRM